jgi:hypothetical protein
MSGVFLALVPVGFARATVTVDVGPAVGLFRGITPIQTVAVGSNELQERSCEAAKSKSRAQIASSNRLGQVEHKGAAVACEQPPRSILNVTGLKNTEANAIAAVG